MSTVTKPRKARQRSINLVLPIGEDGGAGVVQITQDGKPCRYLVERVASQFGSGFLLRKMGGDEVYHVNLNAEGHSCECQGFLRWHHCKHTAGLAALQQAGKL